MTDAADTIVEISVVSGRGTSSIYLCQEQEGSFREKTYVLRAHLASTSARGRTGTSTQTPRDHARDSSLERPSTSNEQRVERVRSTESKIRWWGLCVNPE